MPKPFTLDEFHHQHRKLIQTLDRCVVPFAPRWHSVFTRLTQLVISSYALVFLLPFAFTISILVLLYWVQDILPPSFSILLVLLITLPSLFYGVKKICDLEDDFDPSFFGFAFLIGMSTIPQKS